MHNKTLSGQKPTAHILLNDELFLKEASPGSEVLSLMSPISQPNPKSFSYAWLRAWPAAACEMVAV